MSAKTIYPEMYRKATLELDGADRNARLKATQKMDKEAREKLEASLKGVLDEKQMVQAMASLGTFNGRWDQYVRIVVGFQLKEKKQDNVLRILNQWNIDLVRAMREEGAADQDWDWLMKNQALIQAKQASIKKDLDAALAKALSTEELTVWSAATTPRERRRRE